MSEGQKGKNEALQSAMERCGHFLYHRRGGRMSQERILRILYEWEEEQKEKEEKAQGLSQLKLQTLLGIRSGSVSEIIGKMEAKGLIVKARQETDRRKVSLFLTPLGREELERARLENERQEALLFAALTAGEQKELLGLLEKLLENWQHTFGADLKRHDSKREELGHV